MEPVFVEYFKQIFIPAVVWVGAGLISYVVVIYTDSMILRLFIGSIVLLGLLIILNYILNRIFLIEIKGLVRK